MEQIIGDAMQAPANLTEKGVMEALTRLSEQDDWRLKGGKVVRHSTGREINHAKTHEDICKIMGEFDPTRMKELAIGIAKFRSDAQKSSWNPKYQTVYTAHDFIVLALSHSGIDIGAAGEKITRYDMSISYEILEAHIKTFAREYEADSYMMDEKKPMRPIFPVSRISDDLKVFVNNIDISSREAIKTLLQRREEAIAQNYAYSLFHRVFEIFEVKEDIHLCCVIMMQWMWQTKRYLMGMEVVEPFMINLMGHVQGTMKTSFLEALTIPFSNYRVADAKLKQVLDEREYTLWAKKYVVIFDELQKGSMAKQDYGELVTAMKSLLTAKEVGGRVMKTTHHISMKRIFSAISSSNATIINVIRDRTGMRRFFEITVQTKTKAHPDLITIVQSLLAHSPSNGGYAQQVWQSVDETIPGGYLAAYPEYAKMLTRVQNSYRPVEYWDRWLKSEDVEECPVREEEVQPDTLMIRMCTALQKCNTKKDIELLNTESDPYVWRMDYTINKEATEWVEENIGRESVKYLGGIDNMDSYFRVNGFVVAQNGVETYILCKRDSGSVIAGQFAQGGGVK